MKHSTSWVQKSIYFKYKADIQSILFSNVFVLELPVNIENKEIEHLLNSLISRHEILRTSFSEEDGDILQIVHPIINLNVEHLRLDQSEFEHYRLEFAKPFNLKEIPLFRVASVILNSNIKLLILDFHSIIFDKYSFQILKKEIYKLANKQELPIKQSQYKDYVIKLNESIVNDVYKNNIDFWRKEINDNSFMLDLPVDNYRKLNEGYQTNSISVIFDKHQTAHSKIIVDKLDSSYEYVILAVFNILLRKITRNDEITVGVQNYDKINREDSIGNFTNLFPLITRVGGDEIVSCLIKDIERKAITISELHNIPFNLFEDTKLANSNINCIYSYSEIEDCSEIEWGRIKPDKKNYNNNFLNYSLALFVEKYKSELILNFSYLISNFYPSTIERFINYFNNIINQISDNLDLTISQIEVITNVEKEAILYQFNNTRNNFNTETPIQQIFNEQVIKNPNKVALVFENIQITYSELDYLSDLLTSYLIDDGLQPFSVVGLLVERSPEIIIGIISILKCGCIYLPLDHGYPDSRLEYMVKDCNVGVTLVGRGLGANISMLCKLIDVGDILITRRAVNRKPSEYSPHAYIMYTSGSTGKPKGVLVEQRGVVRLVKFTNYVPLSEETIILQTGAVVFDATTFEMWGALLNGGKLILTEKEEIVNANRLGKTLFNQNVNTLWLSSALFNQLVQDDSSIFKPVKWLLAGGDVLSPSHIRKALRDNPGMNVFNGYGPTENTTFSTTFLIKEDEYTSIPIGKPISNSICYILSNEKTLQPIGIAGELFVGGDGLSAGYLNNPEMTHDKFIDNPYAKGENLYRTGDIARWLIDGNIEFIGRLDNQVKIRGFRIELGEIEKSILELSCIKDCVVLKRTENQENYICAYIVVVNHQNFSVETVRKHISKHLPIYMVPSYFVLLDKLPLTINGKINRKELPAPEVKRDDNFEAPNNSTEEKLLSIWSEVLGVNAKNISINSNFFQFGGHSLKAARSIALIEKELDVKIGLSDFFKCLTIKNLAQVIDSNSKEKYVEIAPALPKRLYSLTTIQRQMYYFYQLNPKNTSYNTPYEMHFSKVYPLNEISTAINTIITRYEILRTNFIEEDGNPFQLVNPNLTINVDFYDLNTITFQQITEQFIKPFKISNEALIRVAYIVNGISSSILVDQPHIITDAQSLVVIEKELKYLLENIKLPDVKLQFKDYSEWVNSIRETPYYKKQEQYWLNLYSDEITALELPYDTKPISLLDKRGKMVSFVLSDEERNIIESFCKDGSTLFTITFAFFNIFLNKITNQKDIIVSIPVAGRLREDMIDMLGMFVNTLVLRTPFEDEVTITDFLESVRGNVIKALDNQDYPLEDLISNTSFARIPGRNPMFDVIFNYLESNINCEELEWNKIRLNSHLAVEAKFDLTFNVKKYNDLIVFEFEYFLDRFKPSTIDRFIQYFNKIINQIAKEPDIRIADIEIISEQERQQLLFDFNFNNVDYPKDKTVHELFRSQAESTPDNIAIKFYDQSITYAELDERSEGLAHVLRNNGIKSDDVVGLLMDRSIETIVGMISILKAGGAYLPIDVNYPKDRKEYLIKDSGTTTILTTRDQKGVYSSCVTTLIIEDLEIESKKNKTLKSVSNPANLCYVIYTSGTTGKPKGVMVEHRNVVRLFFNEKFQFDFGTGDVWTMFHSHCFDFSVWEIYGAILFGGRVVIIPKLVAMDTVAYMKILRREKVTILNQTPSAFYNLLQEEFADSIKQLSLKYIIFGGEALSPGKLEKWKFKYPNTKLINMFGITETTVHVTYKEIGDYEIANNISNVGKPIPTLSLYILDKHQKLLPNGIIGEIYVGGAGVTRGYLGKKELTDTKFIVNPYNSEERLYRSGDLGRVLNSGDIEYIGRIDHQVQLRGFRVELGEIESQLISHNKISEAVVIAKENESDKYLIAYYVSVEELRILEMRNFLLAKLPDYMVPSYYVRLDKLPLTSNGKLDKKALPDPDINIGDDYVAPSNDIEEKLVEIWSEVLSIDKGKISTNSIFFAIGGHSLKAIFLLAKVHKEFNVHVSMRDFLSKPTIRDIAKLIIKNKNCQFESIKNIEKREYYNLSAQQKRIFVVQQMDRKSISYNVFTQVSINTNFGVQSISDALNKIIQRHEILRSGFEYINSFPVQKVYDNINLNIQCHNTEKGTLDDIMTNFIKPFDLAKPPLLRAILLQNKNGNVLVIDMHHIITDEYSMDMLTKEINSLIENKPLKKLKLQYKDFAYWNNLLLNNELVSKQGSYWLDVYKDHIPRLNLVYDNMEDTSKKEKIINFRIDKNLTKSLYDITSSEEITVFSLMLTITSILINKISNENDIVIGIPVSGRTHDDLMDVFGFFVNTIALRLFPNGNKKIVEYIKDVKEKCLLAFDNQDYQYDKLVEDLMELHKCKNRNLFNLIFTATDLRGIENNIDDDIEKSFESINNVAKCDLLFSCKSYTESISIAIIYDSSKFKNDTILRYSNYLLEIAKMITQDVNITLNNIIVSQNFQAISPRKFEVDFEI